MATTPTAYSFITFGVTTPLTPGQQAGLFQIPTLEYISTVDIFVAYTRFSTGETTIVTSTSTDPVQIYEDNGILTADISQHLSNSTLGTLTNADSVRVGRTTQIEQLTRTFSDGSVLKASDLNAQSNQLLFAIQESIDTGSASLPIDIDNRYDAGGRPLKNLGAPVNANDAVTLEYVTSVALYGGAALPQSWFFTLDSTSIVGNDRRLNLSSPVPSSAEANMYLVEVAGVMQRPGQNLDYVVQESNGVYTLVLIGAGAPPASGGLANGTDVTVRNFGTTRNVLVAPFKAGAENGISLEVERIANQTGDLMTFKTENGVLMTRVTNIGDIILGADAVNSVNTAYFSPSQLEIGDVNITQWEKYGIALNNTSFRPRVDIQGREPAATDIAFQITRGEESGNMFPVLSVNYGSNVTVGTGATGKITSPAVDTTTFTCFGNSIYQGPLFVDNAQTVNIGINELSLSRDTISRAKKISVLPWPDTASTDGDFGIQTPNKPGGVVVNQNGNVFIGYGGNGNNGVYGGTGSILFNKNSGSEYGPTMYWTRTGINVRGYNIPGNGANDQGGAAGEDGNNPAFINYQTLDARNTPLASLNDGDLVCKKMVQDAVVRGWWGCMPSDQNINNAPDNSFVKVTIDGVFAEVDPDGKFGYQSAGNLSFTAGTWLVEWEGYIQVSSNQVGQSHLVTVKLEQDNPNNYTAAYVSRSRNLPTIVLQSGTDIENFAYFKIMVVAQGNTVGDNVSLYVRCDFPSLASSRTIVVKNHSCKVQRLT